MSIFYILFIVISVFSFGYDYFFNNAFNKGLIFSPIQKKQLTMKFVLSAALKVLLPLKLFLIVAALIFVFIILLLQLKISILWWISLIVCIFNGVYFVGYLYPKIKRIIHWDIKNPINKWESLYKSYNQSSKILVIISLINSVLIVMAFLNESLHLI